MSKVKTEDNGANRSRCGKINDVEYYCLGNNRCSLSGWCGYASDYTKLSKTPYSPNMYNEIQATCDAMIKQAAADAEAKAATEATDKILDECMSKTKKAQFHPTPNKCGLVGDVKFFCTGERQCSKSNWCGDTPAHINSAQKEFSPNTYKSIKEDCDAKAEYMAEEAAEAQALIIAKNKAINDAKSVCIANIKTEDNEGDRYRCSIVNGVKYYCLANNACSESGYCGRTKGHKKNAQTLYSPTSYKAVVLACEAT